MTSVETIVEIASGKTARVGVPLSRSLNFLKIRDANDLSFPIKGRFSKVAVSGQNYTTVYEGMTFDTGKHGDFDCVELFNDGSADLVVTVLCSDGVILDFVGQKARDEANSDVDIRDLAAGYPVTLQAGKTLLLTCKTDLSAGGVFTISAASRLFLRSIQLSAVPRNTSAPSSYDFSFSHSNSIPPTHFWRGARGLASSSFTTNLFNLEIGAIVAEVHAFGVTATTDNTDFVCVVKT